MGARLYGRSCNGIGFSPWSGRQHKAWGVSPRIREQKWNRARAAGDSRGVQVNPGHSAAARSAGLGSIFLTRSWGSRPRLYADVRSADSG